MANSKNDENFENLFRLTRDTALNGKEEFTLSATPKGQEFLLELVKTGASNLLKDVRESLRNTMNSEEEGNNTPISSSKETPTENKIPEEQKEQETPKNTPQPENEDESKEFKLNSTQQKILEILEANPEIEFSIQEIREKLEEAGIEIQTKTLYNYISSIEKNYPDKIEVTSKTPKKIRSAIHKSEDESEKTLENEDIETIIEKLSDNARAILLVFPTKDRILEFKDININAKTQKTNNNNYTLNRSKDTKLFKTIRRGHYALTELGKKVWEELKKK